MEMEYPIISVFQEKNKGHSLNILVRTKRFKNRKRSAYRKTMTSRRQGKNLRRKKTAAFGKGEGNKSTVGEGGKV